MRFVIVFVTCMAGQPCDLTYPAPYLDFATNAECRVYAEDLFDIPAFRRPHRQITCIEAPRGAGVR